MPLSQFELATRLSYMIWASGPDDALLDAARRGELGSKDAVATKARAMLADPKASVAIADFFSQWSGTSRLDITTKRRDLFPAYTDDMPTAMERGDCRRSSSTCSSRATTSSTRCSRRRSRS